MGHPDYPLQEFASRLATVEERYAKEVQSLVECFCCSRVDLPVKKLEELTRVRLKAVRHLKKVDDKKGELVALWKICNVYSATAVDIDEAMRDIRSSVRKRLKPVQRDGSVFKRFVDDYRPANKRNEPQEIYDTNKPNLKEKQRFLDLFKKKETRKPTLQDAEQSYTQHLVDSVKASYRENRKNVLPPPPLPIASVAVSPQEQNNNVVKEAEKGENSLKMEKKETKIEGTMERNTRPPPPPVAPPRKGNTRTQPAEPSSTLRSVKSVAAPSIPTSKESSSNYGKDMTTVPPTVIQLDWQQKNKDHCTTIRMDEPCTVPPSPQLTIRVSDELVPVPAVRITDGKIYKYVAEAQPARPVLQAQMVRVGEEDHIVDRF